MKKFSLNTLRISSFVTEAGTEWDAKTIKGGIYTIIPQQGCDSNNQSDCCPITTSSGNHNDPNGTIGCP